MAILDLFRLDGKRALITGGSRGLGRAVAQAFAEAGASLVLVGRTLASLETAANELRPLGPRIDIVAADLHGAEAAESMCTRVLEQIGSVDVLVNNVGGRREDVPTEAMTLDAWRGFLDLNLNSAVVCTQRLGAAMLARGWGRVINIASIAGPLVAMRGIEGRHYETAKAALVGFTRVGGGRLGAARRDGQRHRPGRLPDGTESPLVPRTAELSERFREEHSHGAAGRARRDRPAGAVPGERGVALHDRGGAGPRRRLYAVVSGACEPRRCRSTRRACGKTTRFPDRSPSP